MECFLGPVRFVDAIETSENSEQSLFRLRARSEVSEIFTPVPSKVILFYNRKECYLGCIDLSTCS